MKHLSLFKQSSLYSIGNFIISIIGIITFPILTKNLTVNEYGIVGLLTVTIGLVTSLCKIGLQHSVIRFFSEYDYSTFISNTLITTLITTLSVALGVTLLGFTLSYFVDSVLFEVNFLVCIAIIAALGSYQSFIYKVLVAKQKSVAMTGLSIIKKILSTVFIIGIILVISGTAIWFLYATLIAEVLFTCFITVWCLQVKFFEGFSLKATDKTVVTALLTFAIPMMGFEIANMVHAFIDRFFIEIFLSKKDLGLYSAPYNMTTIINSVVLGGITTAIVPAYLKIWNTEGKAATESLLSSITSLFLLFLPAVIAGLYCVGEPLIGFLATDEYKQYAFLLPIIASGVFLHGTNVIFAAGLQINKDSKKMLQYVVESMLINTILNLIFIPIFGIIAAAVVTVISYLWMSCRYYWAGKKTISIKLNWKLLTRSIMYACVMVAVTMQIKLSSDFLLLLSRATLGVFVFLILAFIFETHLRKELLSFLRHRFNFGRNSNSH
ncbi:MAG: oligosaccharide flippase family protein [Cellvibrionaceae bacterium]